MIARMKKITLLVSERSRTDFLFKLREAGVVHVNQIKPALSQDINDQEDKIALLNNAVGILDNYSGTQKEEKALSEEELINIAQEIAQQQSENEEALTRIRDIKTELEWFSPWGGFDPKELDFLKDNGVTVRLYCLRRDEYKRIKDEYKDKIHIIKKEKGRVYLALAACREEERLELNEVRPPQRGFQELKKALGYFNRRIKAIDSFFEENVPLKDAFTKEVKKLERKLQFSRVREGMKVEEAFSYLEGFCPEEYLKKAISLARAENAGYLIEEPDNPEETPTLIKNPGWVRIIEPVFRFMRAIPGYGEYDISPYFLIFFSVFFAMLIGDAGYGIVFLIATFFVQKRLKGLPRELFPLMYLISLATVIWGAITGTYFGFEKIAEIPFLNSLIIDRIDSFVDTNQNFMIYLCFIIGVIHLSIAHLIIAFRMINSLKVLAEAGWISILWGLFFVAGKLVAERPLPVFAGYLLAAGVLFVLLFSNFRRNVIKGVLISLGTIPLKIIGSFSDIVSYLRLFAVGYASVAVAASFNNMALGLGFNSVAAGLGAAFIIFFGHALNILLGLMAVIVHGVRLNMLEFSGQMGIEWSGKEYDPFREKEAIGQS